MPCPSCGEANRPDRLYCSRCGARLDATCSACGAQNEPEEQFCGKCGAPLAAPAATARATPAMPVALAGGRYEVRRFLGEGGKKRVYLATTRGSTATSPFA